MHTQTSRTWLPFSLIALAIVAAGAVAGPVIANASHCSQLSDQYTTLLKQGGTDYAAQAHATYAHACGTADEAQAADAAATRASATELVSQCTNFAIAYQEGTSIAPGFGQPVPTGSGLQLAAQKQLQYRDAGCGSLPGFAPGLTPDHPVPGVIYP
jgi:hypothetical protein